MPFSDLQEWLLGGSGQSSSSHRGRHVERSDTQEIERNLISRRMRGDKWTLDRGAGYYAAERERKKLSYLVQTGK